MKTLSLCITCCDLDFHLVDGLLTEFKKQSEAPDEIIISSSGLSETRLQKNTFININNRQVPVINENKAHREVQAKARNRGGSRSSKDLVMFFDVDDTPHPQKIEVTKQIFEENEVDALIHDYCFVRNFTPINDFSLFFDFEKNPTCTNVEIKNENSSHKIHHSHLTCTSELFKNIKFMEDFSFYRKEDGKFCQDIIDSNFKLCFVDKELVYYST
mgnify:CR=1 FL=1